MVFYFLLNLFLKKIIDYVINNFQIQNIYCNSDGCIFSDEDKQKINNSLFITTDDPKFQFIHFKALESTSYIRLYVAHGYTVKTCNADKLMMKNDINTLVQIYKNVKMI